MIELLRLLEDIELLKGEDMAYNCLIASVVMKSDVPILLAFFKLLNLAVRLLMNV